MGKNLKIRCVFTAPTIEVGMAGGFTPVAEWGWARSEKEIQKEIESVKIELKKIEKKFDGEVQFEGWDILHNADEVLSKSYEIQNSDAEAVLIFGFAVTLPYTHAFLTFNKPLIIFAKEFSKPFYGSNLENAFLAWELSYEKKSRWASVVTDNFDCLSDKINAVRVVSKMKNTKILCLGPVHQHIGGKTLGIGNYEFIREAQEKLGVSVEFVSMDELIKEFDEMKTSKEMVGIYKEFLAHAREKTPDVKKDEALKAVKMYVVLKEFLKRKRADALTISCYQTNLIDRIGSAPCYAVARLNDEGITAGCEADFNALISMLIVSYASNKPVFMGDPIFNEKVPRIVNAHCLCPSRLKGYDKEEPYIATTHYESGRALTQQIVWEEGEQITGTLLSPDLKSMIIIRGKITNTNMGYPACRTQVEFEVDDIDEIWKQCGEHIPFIGHLVTVHGDHSKEIVEVCKIVGIETIVV